MNGNSSYSHKNVGVISVEAVEAPEVVTSDWIDEQLAPTYERWGLRPGLLAELAGGASVEELLREFPYLEREDIAEALRFAAWRMQEREIDLVDAA